MTDADYIIALMRTETDALGFIPDSAIRSRFAPQGLYIIQHDRHGHRRGYLLHGPPKNGQPLHIHQACIDRDHRLRRHATAAVTKLIRRAMLAGSTALLLRCALDLQANAFWQALGFTLTHITQGGERRNRLIAHYCLPLTPHPLEPTHPQGGLLAKVQSIVPAPPIATPAILRIRPARSAP